MIIHLELRNGNLILPKREFDNVFNFDWFLNLLIKYPNQTKNTEDTEDSIVKYTVWEEKNAVLSILDSLRYNKLIVYKTNLDYLEALADKWCVPEWLINEINSRNKTMSQSVNTDNNIEEINEKANKLSCILKRCKICNLGFNILQNTSTSCKRHTGCLSLVDEYTFICCGFNPNNYKENDPRKNGCKIGFHIAED